jgi:hypothetical protein
MKQLRYLIGCEVTGRVREALKKKGHYVMSCDILPTEIEGEHYQGDLMDILYQGWDRGIFFPPCTYVCSSGLHWNKRDPSRQAKTEAAIEFVKKIWNAPIEKIAIENPVGCLSNPLNLGKPSQYIQPYNFGEDASKKTCLWLKGFSLLQNTIYIPPRIVDGKQRWANQCDSGQSNLGGGARLRKKYYLSGHCRCNGKSMGVIWN